MQTSNFLRTFGEAFRQGCRNCIQSVQWSVISKNTLFEKFLIFCMFSDSQLRKWEALAKNLRKSFKWEIYVFRWLFEKDNACCWENIFLHFRTLGEKGLRNWWNNFGSFFQREFYVSRQKFCPKIIFSWILCFFFHFFSTLSYLFSVSLLKLCWTSLENLIWKPNQKFVEESFFLNCVVL